MKGFNPLKNIFLLMSKVYFPLIYQVFTFNLPLIIYSDIQCIIGGNKFIDEETRLKMTLIS